MDIFVLLGGREKSVVDGLTWKEEEEEEEEKAALFVYAYSSQTQTHGLSGRERRE